MISRGRRQRGGATTDESEALQTDVMRFLAIICMCLMVIFALVQSLPVSEAENKPKMQSKEILEREIEILKENADKLKQDLVSLEKNVILKKKQVEQNSKEIIKQRNSVKKLDSIAKKKLKEIKRKRRILSNIDILVKSAKKQEEKFRKLNKQAQKELLKKQSDLNKTASLIENGRDELEKVEAKLDEAKVEIEKIVHEQEITEPTKESEPKSKPEEQKEEQKEDSKPAREEKEGFTLGFASNAALLKLLKKGNMVELYILAGNKSWKLKVKHSGSVVFLSAPAPKKIYQMDYQTVPEKIIRAGKRVVAAFGKNTMTYAVVLAPKISRQFSGLMKGKKGGGLVISATGKVTLE
ncbi:MAG: hypothetical protein B6I31_04000 [Desulfobacteraceae bacterium 4572_19]|nr:MAG: hypothetical protein B6I31_04000 [Desulfobacteraceae bacterium 4572_19]